MTVEQNDQTAATTGHHDNRWARWNLPRGLEAVLKAAPTVFLPEDRGQLVDLAVGGKGNHTFEVAYDVAGKGRVVEATVVRCRNGLAVNYLDKYMRRRDPDCMFIADDLASDKPDFGAAFGRPFEPVRTEVLHWLSTQELIVLPFLAGGKRVGADAVLVAPVNASFFAAALADLQAMVPASKVPSGFAPRAVLYLAPPFRHSCFDGRQVVVHSRSQGLHEVFSLNLYPGPSAKKGVYGVLITLGESEGWTTLHGSTVEVVTPYDNVLTLMHEGASGGGKSEMLEYPHREEDGRLLLGRNLINGERHLLALPRGCRLRPVTDDMALCHPDIEADQDEGKLVVTDAEEAWFLRINHISQYGTDPLLERVCVHAPEPLIFLNLEGVPGATCLIWEHTEDEPGKPCPNPRVIVPRRLVPDVVNEPVAVDVRSFGIRTPPCTRQAPSYGIVGLLHVLPRALGWLWRLTAPRGHESPSITDTSGMTSEGVGSYWPFATGRRVDQANLLLQQIMETPRTRYKLIPNQHIGCWKVGFMPQWVAREYLARRGSARLRPDQLTPARCPLLGFAMKAMLVEGMPIPDWFLQVNMQPEVGDDGYDAGAKILTDFFQRELDGYLQDPDLDPFGRQIIQCCMDGGSLDDYLALTPLS